MKEEEQLEECPLCDGTGFYVVDTGGFSPQDGPIYDELDCPRCQGTGLIPIKKDT